MVWEDGIRNVAHGHSADEMTCRKTARAFEVDVSLTMFHELDSCMQRCMLP